MDTTKLDNGWILDAHKALCRSMQLSPQGDGGGYVPRRNYFSVTRPYGQSGDKDDEEPRKKKRRRAQPKKDKIELDSAAIERRDAARHAIEEIRRRRLVVQHVDDPEHEEGLEETMEHEMDLPSLLALVSLAGGDQPGRAVVLDKEEQQVALEDLFNTLLKNDSRERATVVRVQTHAYIVPPLSQFLISDLGSAYKSLPRSVGSRFNIVLMDPPWPNASASRSTAYSTMDDCYDLFKLPIRSMLDPERGSLVAVWITNRPKYRRFVTERLLPDWGLEVTAEWLWVKTTTDGQPVIPLDSSHRQPYESLIIGTRRPRPEPEPEPEPEGGRRVEVQAVRTVVACPSLHHSRKPGIHGLLQDMYRELFDDVAVPVELFARHLVSGWSSWGNEAIRFQNARYWMQQQQQRGIP
ncbi:hypothetical protein RI367_002972 [Sorochytrium milnesiophthora]